MRGVLGWPVFIGLLASAGLSRGSDASGTGNAGVLNCARFPGATAGAKIQACIDGLPATGGAADAREIIGAQSWPVDFFATETKPITLLLGAGTNALSASMTVPPNATIVFAQGSLISVAKGKTLTYKGSMQGPIGPRFRADDSVTGTVILESRYVNEVHPQYWGAAGDGATDDYAAIKAMIEAVRSRGRPVVGGPPRLVFPPGRYRVGRTIEMKNTRSEVYNGLMISGSGWAYGDTPEYNRGTWIEYARPDGSLFRLQGRGSDTGPIENLIVKDIGLQAVHPDFSGSLVELRTVSRSSFQNVAFFGRRDARPKPGSRLVFGDQWVDLAFSRCWFNSAQYGIRQAPVSGMGSFANIVALERSWFNRLDTSVHITRNTQAVLLSQIVGEPSADTLESPFVIGGMAPVIENSWFGDGKGSRSWIILNGASGARISGNYLSKGLVGVLVTGGSRRGTISDNVIGNVGVGIKYENAALGPVAQNNFIALPRNGIGIEVTTVHGDVQLLNNGIDAVDTGSNTTAYKFAPNTVGTLYDNRRGAGITRHVDDRSSGGWDITTSFERSMATRIPGFAPGRGRTFSPETTETGLQDKTGSGVPASFSCPSGKAIKGITTAGGVITGVTCGPP